MASAVETNFGAMYDVAKEMIPLWQALVEMGWPQGRSYLQTDKSTAEGVVNNTFVPKRLKSMDLRNRWLWFREAQGQFRFSWAPGVENWGDYYTKNHPLIHHISLRPQYTCILLKLRGANFLAQ